METKRCARSVSLMISLVGLLIGLVLMLVIDVLVLRYLRASRDTYAIGTSTYSESISPESRPPPLDVLGNGYTPLVMHGIMFILAASALVEFRQLLQDSPDPSRPQIREDEPIH